VYLAIPAKVKSAFFNTSKTHNAFIIVPFTILTNDAPTTKNVDPITYFTDSGFNDSES
jgi:hypothetical protein